MDKNIAIIGLSCKFHGINSINEFNSCLMNGMDGNIEKFAKERGRLLGIDNYAGFASNVLYINGIENFDYKFFGISKKEASCMSPEMKLTFQGVTEALINAGIPLSSLKDKNAGLVIAQSSCDYRSLIENKDAMSFTGNLIGMTAGNIAYHLDMHGPAMLVDSTCSSSLLAVWEAAQYIMTGQADIMVAGGAEIIFQEENTADEFRNITVNSESMKCIPFDEDASGMIPAEGCGYVVLKEYSKAVADGDHIYGVIKGGAVNCNGARSNTMTTPNKEAQVDAIRKAWSLAGVGADDITDIEAHGTGTKIGDPIEAGAFNEVLKDRTSEKPVYVSAAKSYIGHTGNASGVAGLISVLTGFEYDSRYMINGFKKLNSNIQNSDKLAFLNKSENLSGHKRRVASVNSLGFSGVNVHLVIENYNNETTKNDVLNEANRLIVLSAKSKTAYLNYVSQLINEIENYSSDINDIVYSINTGRDLYKFRRAFICSNKEELLNKLKESEEPFESTYKNTDIADAADKNIDEIADMINAGQNVVISKLYSEVNAKKVPLPQYPFDKSIAWAIDIKDNVEENTPDNISASASEISTVSSPEKKYTVDEMKDIIKEIWMEILESDEDIDFDTSFFELGGNSLLGSVMIEELIARTGCSFDIVEIYEKNTINLLADYLVNNNGVTEDETADTEQQVTSEKAEETVTPVYEAEEKADENSGKKYTVDEMKDIIKEIWMEILESDEDIDFDTSFFELGGNSLLGSVMIEELIARTGCSFDIVEIYEKNTINLLADYLVNNNSDPDNKTDVEANS